MQIVYKNKELSLIIKEYLQRTMNANVAIPTV